ncbi:unnamed protein product [Peronospora destructor]|uniref:Importin-7/11-like TPR repeats domain-containing protein n=1 Tax=Peronospora destructor TaxID=86335 RepID=A0AAV0TG47_9STRA|nr:unnamed protein product [Peronospora destructor]
MAIDLGRMRELLVQSLRAPEPQRSAAEEDLQQLQHCQLTAPFPYCAAGNDAWQCPTLTEHSATRCNLPQKTWTKTNTLLLSDEEHVQVRGLLLFAALYEPQQTVALHLSLIVATIARTDFPAQWTFETLFPMMLQPLRRQDGVVNLSKERRGMDVCYRVVKELAARRLMQHRKQFAMLSVELLPLLLQYWTATATQFSEFLQAQEEATELTSAQKAAAIMSALTTQAEQLEVLTTTAKLISTMLLNAFKDLVALKNGDLMRSAFVEFETRAEVEKSIRLLDKCLHRIAAIVVGGQNSYPIEFREYLLPYLMLFWNVLNLFADNPLTALSSPGQPQIDALQFFANVLSCRLYKNESLSGPDGTTRIMSKVITATGDVALTDAIVLEAQAAVQAFFKQTENWFTSMMNLIVMRYMRLTATDLKEWESDPEAYCTFRGELDSEGVELSRGQVSDAGDDRRILDADTVLLAIGLGCYDLHDCFEFEPWFLTHLVPILVNPDAAVGSFKGRPVLRFRIVWLVSCWLAQLTSSVRPPLYEALLNSSALFYQTDADVALKLRIIQTLESMVNDWGFEHDAFAPFLPRALEFLFALFPQTSESESKMKVLGCLEAIVQACGVHIISFCHQISVPLPELWTNESDASNFVRGKLLQLMAKLLQNVKEAQKTLTNVRVEDGSVHTLFNMCVQVVRFATNVSNPEEVFLMESGLELWNETLEVSTVYTEELHVLFGNVLRLMERDYEYVSLVLNVLKQYLRLGKVQFWQSYHASVTGLLRSVIGNVKAEASLQIVEVAEIVVATIPADQVGELMPVVKAMVEACITFQQKEQKHEPETVVAGYLSVVARLMIIDFDCTLKTVLANDHTVLQLLVDAMLRLFYIVGVSPLTPLRRKAWALALGSTLMSMEQQLLERTGQVLEICVRGVYRAFQAHHKMEQQQLRVEDVPILALDLKAFVCGRLNDLAAKLGTSTFDRLLETVDSSMLRKLQS